MNKINRREALLSTAALITFPIAITGKPKQGMTSPIPIGWHNVPNRFYDITKESKHFSKLCSIFKKQKDIEFHYYFYRETNTWEYSYKSNDSKIKYTPRFINIYENKTVVELIPTETADKEGNETFMLPLDHYINCDWSKKWDNILVVEYNGLINGFSTQPGSKVKYK